MVKQLTQDLYLHNRINNNNKINNKKLINNNNKINNNKRLILKKLHLQLQQLKTVKRNKYL